MARSQVASKTPPAEVWDTWRFGPFELRGGRELWRDGAPVAIGGIALRLLVALLSADGALVTRRELFDAAWPGLVVVENALHQHLRALRLALADQGARIVNVPRRGYRFAGDCERLGPDGGSGPVQVPPVPLPPSPLIGRDEEVEAVERLLQARRCVTLLGPSGVGKTRLALEVARRQVERGVATRWVELATVSDAGGVAGAIAVACGLAAPSALPSMLRVRHALREAAVLLVVDNCEHLADAVAVALHDLLRVCASVRVLTTSQCPLGIRGEQQLRLSMLGLPPLGEFDAATLRRAPAMQLLLARIGEVDAAAGGIDGASLQEAVGLCRQLDGHPLAIELAASRVVALGLAATRSALVEQIRLLADGPSADDQRHRSLEAALDWSHGLLGEAPAALWRRLSVFRGGWTPAAAAAVAAIGLDEVAAYGLLAELVGRSLVVANGSRLRMLETQRLYALDQLRAHGELDHVARRHAQHFAALFEAGHAEWDTTPDAVWLARHGPEHDNLRAALRFAMTTADAPLASRLVGASIWLWRATGTVHELKLLLDHPWWTSGAFDRATPAFELARALVGYATSSEALQVRAVAQRAAAAVAGGDAVAQANALLCLASAHASLGDAAGHVDCLRRVERLPAGRGQGKAYAWYCGSQAWATQQAGDIDVALAWARESHEVYRGCGAWHGETRALLHLADLQLIAGDTRGAVSLGETCVARLQGSPHREDLGRACANLGAAWLAQGEPGRARVCLERALHELRGLDFSFWVFDHVAVVAVAEGRDEAAARMIGHADAGYARLRKHGRVQSEQRSRDRVWAHLVARHPLPQLAAWLAKGARADEAEMMMLAQV